MADSTSGPTGGRVNPRRIRLGRLLSQERLARNSAILRNMHRNRLVPCRPIILFLALAIALTTLSSCRGRSPCETVPARSDQEIAAKLRADVEYLSSDELAGRMLGEDGIAAAEEYIAGRFEAAGLAPSGETNGYFQDFAVTRTEYTAVELVLEATAPELTYVGVAGHDFRPLPFSRSADLAGDLVFAGYGISAPSLGHDDYDGLAARGKVAFVLRGEPDTSDPSSAFYGEGSTVHASFKTKAEAAYRAGAIGIVVVNPVGHPERPTDFTVFPSFELDAARSPPPELTARVGSTFAAVFSSSTLLEWVCAQWGATPAGVVSQMDDGIAPASLNLPELSIHLQTELMDPVRGVAARNVVGLLSGDRKDRFIIVGAHHDHLGTISGEGATPGADTIFNGADDNASGVAVVLEVAQRLATANLHTSVIFVTFSGEEHGLFGSTAFVTAGVVDMSEIDLMINVDMAGRNAAEPMTLYLGGDSPIPSFRLQSIADSVALPVVVHDESLGRDDSLPFDQSGVPTMFAFSGFHDDYHGVDDEADRLDYDHLAAVTDFVECVVRAAAGE
jgi:hypothetical protein